MGLPTTGDYHREMKGEGEGARGRERWFGGEEGGESIISRIAWHKNIMLSETGIYVVVFLSGICPEGVYRAFQLHLLQSGGWSFSEWDHTPWWNWTAAATSRRFDRKYCQNLILNRSLIPSMFSIFLRSCWSWCGAYHCQSWRGCDHGSAQFHNSHARWEWPGNRQGDL
jgi:hypothetical protein